jgi:hypothetical protein
MPTTLDDTTTLPVSAPAATAGVINHITIHLPPLSATQAVSQPLKAPKSGAPASTKPSPIFNVADSFKPEVYYDADGMAKYTRYTASDGASAVLRENPKDHRAVTLILTDKNGSIITQGDARGFQAVLQDGKKQSAEPWRVVYDTLTCPTGKKQTTANETESVTRDKLKQFAEDHRQLASVLRGVELPVTVMGELPVTFAKAIDTPSQYRACPENRSGIVIERLTEKSAKR